MMSTTSLHSIAYDVIEYCQVEFDIQSVYVVIATNTIDLTVFQISFFF